MRTMWLLLLMLGVQPVLAADPAGVTLSPISISLDAQHPASAVTLTNGTAEEKIFQADVVSWTHEQGEDRHAPTKELLVSPPMFRVPAGGRQVIRIGTRQRSAARTPREKTYRLFLQEVPGSSPVTPAEAGGVALKLLLRFGLPVFIRPSVEQPASLHWQLRVLKEGAAELSLANRGNRHVKVSNIQLQVADQSIGAEGFAYVFADETRVWKLNPAKPLQAAEARLSASTETGPLNASIAIQGP